MAAADFEFEMKQCFKCEYYYPNGDLNEHIEKCKRRVLCLKCRCDYPGDELEQHSSSCRGFEDMVCFITEYSRKKYSYATIRYLLKEKLDVGRRLSGREVLKIMNADEFDLKRYINDVKNLSFMECPLCSYQVFLDDIFVLSCDDNHKICYDCFYYHSLRSLSIARPLVCPIGYCEQIIHINELRSLPFPRYMVRKLVEKYDTQLFDEGLGTGVIKCINNSCNWVAVFDATERHNVKCMKCNTDFCVKCRKIGHYRTECKDVEMLKQNWKTWCEVGREARKTELNHPDRAGVAYRKAVSQVKKSNEILIKNFPKLKKDEIYKQSRCRYCPYCFRIVEKTEGCNVMLCGEDFHGDENDNRDDIQDGCGNTFDWTKAKPYESQVGKKPILNQLLINKPGIVEDIKHFPYKCDNCRLDIAGIRFECVNCECINFCEQCEEEATQDHPENHIFKIIFEKKPKNCSLM